MKKKFLVDDVENVKSILEAKSETYHFYPYPQKETYVYELDGVSYILELYKKELKPLSLLLLISKKDFDILEELKSLKDVTEDKRYSKRYLKNFGNPVRYDFDIEAVYQRCESVGLERMDLKFKKSMNSAKVFKVLLYRLNQLLKLNCEQDIDKKSLQKSIKEIKNVFDISEGVFDKELLGRLKSYFKEKKIFIENTDLRDEYFLNFEAFIKDDSEFYESTKSDTAIYYFVRKAIFKNLQKANKTTQKSKRDRYITNIKTFIKHFSSMLKPKEIEAIEFQIEMF